MPIKVAICDDDKRDLQIIKDCLTKFSIRQNTDYEISCYTDGKALVKDCSDLNPYVIAFLDIEMPEPDGLEIASFLRSNTDSYCYIIFVSSYPKYMKSSFKIQPFDFITKPVSYEEFEETMLRLSNDMSKRYVNKASIQTESGIFLTDLSNILYLTTTPVKSGSVSFILTNNKISGKGRLLDWEQRLSAHSFIRCHKCYIVNILHIKSLQHHTITMDNGNTIPIGRSYDKCVNDKFTRNILDDCFQ
jgi:DNA-binding LytR/AlgR family response regulator